MNQTTRYALVLFLGVPALFHGCTAIRILLPWNFSLQATPVTMAELAAGKYPDGGYLEVKDGYLAPYQHGPQNSGDKPFIGESWGVYPLLTREDVAIWNAHQPEEPIDLPGSLSVCLNPEQLSQFWPEAGDGMTRIDARNLRPVQRSLTGDVKTISYSYPPGTPDLAPNAPRTLQYMTFERHRYGPWNLAKSLIFTACTLQFIRLLLKGSRSAVSDETPPEYALAPGSTHVPS